VSATEQVEWKIAQLERARSAEQIHQQHYALLQAIVEGTEDALFVKDHQGRYLMINSAGAQPVGKSVEEVLGKDDLQLFTPETARPIMEHDRRIIATGRAETFEQTGTAAGITKTWLATIGPYRNQQGEVVGVIGIARDITERKRLEIERDALLERLRLQIDRLPLGYVLWDARHRVLDWNPAAERIFGYSKAEALGRIVFELINTMPLSGRLRELVRRLEAGDMQTNNVNENRTKDGRTITCEWFNTPLIGADGKITGIISLAQDITERRLADDALRQYAERLQLLSRRVVEVQEEERRHLARELHDEIGQVLSAVSVNLQVLKQASDAAAWPRLEESTRIVNDAIQQVRNLALDLRPAMLDDLGLIPTLRWYADRQSQRAGFLLHFDADSTGRRLPPEVETTCYRIVQEALTNVVRHAQAKRVWLELREESSQLKLVIRDDGIGFDPVHLQHRATPEAGIGVQGMRERVDLLNGTIKIKSNPGRGTTIEIRIPLASKRPNRAAK
jgi:PAS domain S-box-containing protein